jgi:hypothetical protein
MKRITEQSVLEQAICSGISKDGEVRKEAQMLWEIPVEEIKKQPVQ